MTPIQKFLLVCPVLMISLFFILFVNMRSICETTKSANIDLPTSKFDYSRWEGKTIELSLDDMASLPEEKILLSGHWRDSTGPIHSALFFSEDGGKTWKDIDLKFPNSSILHLNTFGISYFWGLVTFRAEGCMNPTHLIRSVDCGKNWDVFALEFIEQKNPLEWTKQFEFFDDQNGLLIIDGSLGKLRTYTSSDGGKTWKPLLDVTTDDQTIEQGGSPVQNHSKNDPRAAFLWEKQMDIYVIIGVLGVKEMENKFSIERYLYDTDDQWHERSEFPKHYRIMDNRNVSIDDTLE